MDYYRNSITDQSWQVLQTLSRAVSFTLIGGWAVWLYTNALKSKDIDIIIDLPTLGVLRDNYEVRKNDRLHKYEIVRGTVNIDIYVPHWSELGLPIETITATRKRIQGFAVPKPEILLVLKQVAYTARVGSAKGKKDLLDIVSLAKLPEFSWNTYRLLVRKVSLPIIPIVDIISPLVDVPELSLNRHQFAKMKKRVLNLLSS